MGPTPGVLQEVNIPIWTNSECKSKYGPAAPGGIVDSFLCAGKDWMDSCSVSTIITYQNLLFQNSNRQPKKNYYNMLKKYEP